MNSLVLIAALALSGVYLPPQMRAGDTLYGTSTTVHPYSASGIRLELSNLTGHGGPLDFWVYDKQEWRDRLHAEIPTPSLATQLITVSFTEPFLFDQVLVRGMGAIAPWYGQRLTFTGAVYSTVPESSSLLLAGVGLLALAVFHVAIRKWARHV